MKLARNQPILIRLLKRTKCMLAEGLGTGLIVFMVGSAAINEQLSNTGLGLLGAALVSGLSVMVMIYALGHVSGAHFNPAVTLAFAVTKKFPFREVPSYLIAQLIGASLAASVLRLSFGNVANLGANVARGNIVQALVFESIASFFLMFVIMGVATDSRAVGQAAGLVIGITVVVAILIAGPVSGASMNPARSFGPALLSGMWQDHWLYWLCPIGGMTIGALTYQVIRYEETTIAI